MLAWTFASVVAVVAMWRTAVAHARIERSAAYGRERDRSGPPGAEGSGRLGVVVPLLEEQDRLPGLLGHFDALADRVAGLELHVVTSEKEGRSETSTYALCRAAASKRPYLHHHHCPDSAAIMAHQLNIVCDSADVPERLVLYNADSRPAAESVRFAGEVLASGADGGPRVCQQYGAYLANADAIAGPSSPILLAAALWQTRWSQAFELARALENLEPRRLDRLRGRRLAFGAGGLPRMNYVIGHGLAIPRSFLAEFGGFTTGWHNEDAVLGLHLALAGEPIVPNPYLEPADSPDTVAGLLTQKSVWWTGPGLAPWYPRRRPEAALAATACGGTARSGRLWTAWMTAALTHHALCWLMGPAVLVGALAVVVLAPAPGLVAVAAIWVYLAWPNDAAARRLLDYGLPVPLTGVRVRGVLGAPVMYVLHGLSAWLGLGRAVARVFVPDLRKPKTPMRSSRPTWRPS